LVGPLGFILNQNAYQQGSLLAPVMSIITACDPLISIILAAFLLKETLSSSTAAIAGQVMALGVMTTGIVVIAHCVPQVPSKRAAAVAARRPSPDGSGAPGEAEAASEADGTEAAGE
jgi:hypothetical protein